MRSTIALVSCALACLAVLAAQNSSQNLPKFRAGVDVVEWDVSVYDKDHHPIKGLTAADFTVLEDKLPRPLAAFSEVDIPEPPPPTAAWMRDAVDDVATNSVQDRRLSLIVIDDASYGEQMISMTKAWRDSLKQAVRAYIDRLSSIDLAAIVFTGDNRRSQGFTADHGRLLAALNQTSGGTMMPTELQIPYSVEVLRRAADYLIGTPGRRKSMVDFTDFDMDMAFKSCNLRPVEPFCEAHEHAREQTQRIFESAQRAGINVYPMRLGGRLDLNDGPSGIGKGMLTAPLSTSDPNAVGPDGRWFTSVPHQTAGEAFVGVADPKVAERAAQKIFEAMSSYYMLGYTSAAIDKFHLVKVLVSRPGAEVRTREKYFTPIHEKAESGPALPATLAAMSGILPKADIPLRATAAPFASPDGAGTASVALTIDVHHVRADGATGPIREALDLRAAAFTAEGDARGSTARTIDVRLPPGRGDMEYEILQRIDLAKPGLYELRLSTHSAARNADGSVYVTIDVPDFAKAPLSLSGLVLTNDNGLAIDGVEALRALVPITPTTARTFEPGEPATAFLRVYQGGGRTMQPVATRTRILDEHDHPVLDRQETLAPARFDRLRAAGMLVRLPTAELAAGSYLLRIEATLAKATVERELRFTIH